jgi:hypothetical protein
MPDIRLREAVAVYLFGKKFTEDQLKSIGIFRDGRWYKYPVHGEWRRVGNTITISRAGKTSVTYQ